jgi:phosphopantothenoylcysteine decarboxylase/phosphopantothenate--cysteine ligase
MHAAVMAALPGAEALIMAAAVADFRPAAPAGEKIKKEAGIPEIRLEKTVDILAAAAEEKTRSGYPHVTIGFAAESQDLLENARRKLNTKRLDLIVANDITAQDAGFAVDSNRVTLLFSSGQVEKLPLMSKEEAAERVLEELVRLLDPSDGG